MAWAQELLRDRLSLGFFEGDFDPETEEEQPEGDDGGGDDGGGDDGGQDGSDEEGSGGGAVEREEESGSGAGGESSEGEDGDGGDVNPEVAGEEEREDAWVRDLVGGDFEAGAEEGEDDFALGGGDDGQGGGDVEDGAEDGGAEDGDCGEQGDVEAGRACRSVRADPERDVPGSRGDAYKGGLRTVTAEDGATLQTPYSDGEAMKLALENAPYNGMILSMSRAYQRRGRLTPNQWYWVHRYAIGGKRGLRRK